MLMTDVDIDDNDDIDVQGGLWLQLRRCKCENIDFSLVEIELITNTLLILLGCIMMHRLNNKDLPTQSQHQLPRCSASMPRTLWTSEHTAAASSKELPSASTSASTC